MLNFLLQVPGHKGNFVYIRDAFFKKPDFSVVPFPAFEPSEDDDLSPQIADYGEVDPFLEE